MVNALRSFLLSTVILLGTFSFGQSLNVSGGYTASWMRIKGVTDEPPYEEHHDGPNSYTRSSTNKNVSGFNVGVLYEFSLGQRLSLETGFRFQTRGYKIIKEETYEQSSSSYSQIEIGKKKMNYLDLPVILNTAISVGKYRFYARTGAYLGFLTKMKSAGQTEYNINGEILTSSSSYLHSKGKPIERLTYGLIAGIGVEHKNFYFETNYNLGFHSYPNQQYGAYTHDLSFSLGYKIKFKREK